MERTYRYVRGAPVGGPVEGAVDDDGVAVSRLISAEAGNAVARACAGLRGRWSRGGWGWVGSTWGQEPARRA